MSGDEQNDDVRASIERVNQARRERSDAAWRPLEEKWAALVTARYVALRALRRNKFRRGTLADADAAAALREMLATMAREAAETAHRKDFESRWGFRVLERVLCGKHLCVVYNNHTYADVPTRRDRELADYRRWMADAGLADLAYAEHPDRGRYEGYSYALLLLCEPGSEPYVEEQYEAIGLRSLAGIPWKGRGGTTSEGE